MAKAARISSRSDTTEVARFIKDLNASDNGEIVRLAFEFLILTAARTGEVLNATWTEIDKTKTLWTVPADRMKAGREHRVPLSARCMAILERAKVLAADSTYLFPGRSALKPLSNMVFVMVLRRMKQTITAHGFRSTFRDWAAEATSAPREIAEMALAHTLDSKVEAAYRRSDLLDKRRDLMDQWAKFCAAGLKDHLRANNVASGEAAGMT